MPDDATRKRSARFYDRLGFGAAIVVFGGTALWSVAAPIDGAVVASGQIVVESNRKTVQHLEGGMVDQIMVREGDLIRAGDVVARLEDTVARANAALINSQLTELYARRVRLETERDQADDLATARGASDILESDDFKTKLNGQNQLFKARQRTRTTQISMLRERIVQQKERITGHDAQIRSLKGQLFLIRDELDGVQQLHDQGYAPKTRLRELQRAQERLTGERGALDASIAEADSIIAEAKLEIERLLETAREDAIAELRDVEVRISELEERRIAALDALSRTEIRAPQSGRVLGLAVHTVGGVISPGEPLMQIVPANDRLIVQARIDPKDIDRVQPGQEALLRFTAFGSRRTPEATGAVKSVSADAMIDQATGVPFFMVLVEIPTNEHFREALSDRQLVPGMPVEAFIRTGVRPAITYFLRPLMDSMARSMREE